MSSSRLRKLLLPLLRGYIAGKPRTFARMETARQGIFLLQKPVSLKSKAAKVRREQQRTSARQSHNQETAAIREEVFRRAEGECEHCGILWENTSGGQLDHWLSGIGRRRQKQTVATTWALCPLCHWRRTRNNPTAAYWNAAFRDHCATYAYRFTPHIIHAEPAKAGGAP